MASRFDTEADFRGFIDKVEKNKNTLRKTVQDITLLREFIRTKDVEITVGEHDIEHIEAEQLNTFLSQFIVAVRKKDGSDYEPATLRSIVASIERYLREKNYPKSVINDQEFKVTRQVLYAKQKALKEKGKGLRPNATRALTVREINRLIKTKQLGMDSPQTVINTLWWNNIFNFGIKSLRDHHDLKWGEVTLKTDDNGKEFLQYNNWNSITKATRVAWSTTGDPSDPMDPCSVYKKYATVRPSDALSDSSPFYLGIRTNSQVHPTVWFKNQAHGVNSLSAIMKNMMIRAGLVAKEDSKLTNYAVAKTCVNHLRLGSSRLQIGSGPGKPSKKGLTKIGSEEGEAGSDDDDDDANIDDGEYNVMMSKVLQEGAVLEDSATRDLERHENQDERIQSSSHENGVHIKQEPEDSADYDWPGITVAETWTEASNEPTQPEKEPQDFFTNLLKTATKLHDKTSKTTSEPILPQDSTQKDPSFEPKSLVIKSNKPPQKITTTRLDNYETLTSLLVTPNRAKQQSVNDSGTSLQTRSSSLRSTGNSQQRCVNNRRKRPSNLINKHVGSQKVRRKSYEASANETDTDSEYSLYSDHLELDDFSNQSELSDQGQVTTENVNVKSLYEHYTRFAEKSFNYMNGKDEQSYANGGLDADDIVSALERAETENQDLKKLLRYQDGKFKNLANRFSTLARHFVELSKEFNNAFNHE